MEMFEDGQSAPARDRNLGARTYVLLALCTLALASCGNDKHPAKSVPAPKLQPVQPRVIPGADQYREAMSALAAGNEQEATSLLERSVRTNSKLTEAWYELGRIKVKRAPDLAKSDEQAGIVMFREGLEAEREALRLIDAGQAVLWTNEDQLQAREKLDADLVNTAEALNDEDSLREALRMRVH